MDQVQPRTQLTPSLARKVIAMMSEFRWPLAVVVILVVGFVLQGAVTAAGSKIAFAFGGGVHDLILQKSLRNVPGLYYMRIDWAEFASLFGNHLRLVVLSLGWAIVVSTPIGLLVHRIRVLYLPTFVLLDAFYTIPSLAVFPILIETPHFGVSDATVVVVVVAYAQFILVRNVYAGLETVPPEVKEAARGMGMSRLQIFMHIEFPLALPVMVAGLRIATVAAIGICSIGALTGIPDLGHMLFAPAASGGVNAVPEVDTGVLGLVALALGADLILGVIERLMPARRALSRSGRRQSFLARSRYWVPFLRYRYTFAGRP